MQGLPSEASPGFMASLSRTEEVLDLVRRGSKAKCNIEAGSLPVKVDSIRLPDQTCQRPWPGFTWSSLQCQSIEFSTCGQYLAVVLMGEQTTNSKGRQEPFPSYQVVVYSFCVGYGELARFCVSSLEPDLHWDQKVPQLGVVQVSELRAQACAAAEEGLGIADPTLLTAVFVYDAAAGRILHTLGQQSSDLFAKQLDDGSPLFAWAPSGRHLLLVHGDHSPAFDEQTADEGGATADEPTESHTQSPASSDVGSYAEGLDSDEEEEEYLFVYIVDVVHDKVLAYSRTHTVGERSDEDFTAVIWHPTVPGVIFDSRTVLEDHAAFTQAGFLTGTLPWHPWACYHTQHAPDFSADARFLIAESTVESDSDSPSYHKWGRTYMRKVWAVLFCSVGVTNIGFATQECLDGETYTAWLPSGAKLLVHQLYSGRSVVVHYPEEHHHPLPQVVEERACFSPSARFFMDKGKRGGLRILDSQSGQQHWELPASDAKWLSFMLPGQQSSMKLKHGSGFSSGYFEWLPSGLGVICHTHEFRRTEPLSLHVLWFA